MKILKGVLRCPTRKDIHPSNQVTIKILDARDPKKVKHIAIKRLKNIPQFPHDYEVEYDESLINCDDLFGYEVQVRVESNGDLSHMHTKNVQILDDSSSLKEIIDIDLICLKKSSSS